MKKYLLNLCLLSIVNILWAQKIPVSTVQQFSTLLSSKNVSIPIVNGNIDFVINNTSSGENVIEYNGILKTPYQGGVSIRISNQQVEGEIIAPFSKQVWKISSQNGFVYVEQSLIENQLCTEEEANRPIIETSASSLRTQATIAESRKLQSFPAGKAVIYIDFDGHTVTDAWWTNNYNSGQPWYCTPANISADNEITVWKVVSEDYRPFNVNVTTDSTVFLTYPATERQRLIVTRNASWQTVSTTGIGRIGGFGYYSSGPEASPCFSFPGGFSSSNPLSTTSAEKLGEVSAHELGHAFGLTHDGGTGTNYYSGHGTWAPIMGSGYNRVCTQWSKGEYTGANNTQDDLAIIANATNGFGYKTDDYGNDYNTASVLTIVSDSVKRNSTQGLIEKSTDVDAFKFSVSANSAINLVLVPFEVKPNLDIKVSLYKADNTLVTSNDISGSQNTSLSTTIAAGDYYLVVDGVGYGSPLNTGYSEYASIGYYSIYGKIPNAKVVKAGNLLPTVAITSPANNANLTSKTNVTVSATASDADGKITKVEFYNGNTLLSTVTSAPYQYIWQNIAAGNYTFTAKAYDDSSASSVSSVVNVIVKDSLINVCTATAWSSTTIYLGDVSKGAGKGEVVSYNGRLYRALYWTQNNNPATSANWTDIGSCEVLTSIESNENISSIQIYPNPSNGIINISVLVDEVQINNLIGNVILHSPNPTNVIDISHLNKGMYFITLKINGKQLIYKLVKE